MSNTIVVEHLTKKYGTFEAVKDISFSVRKGEVFGLLGENGAGKTTTLEMIEGLRKPSSGKISVLDLDSKKYLAEIKQKIGVQLQSSAYFDFLKLTEILDLFGSFYIKKVNKTDLLSLVGLKEKANQYVKNLSGGQKQRFSIIASLINDPEIVFLDEPTTGLDPLARRNLWEVITKIKKRGKTVILTTHYMEEAEVLCDRIALMDFGKIIAMDKTHKLIEKTSYPYKVSVILSHSDKKLFESLREIGHVSSVGGKENDILVKIKTKDELNKALDLVQKSQAESFSIGRASLEDLFLELTGHSINQEDNSNA